MATLAELVGLTPPASQKAAAPDLRAYLRERANFHGVDPDLAESVFRQESSSGRNAATSTAGARGPMQLLPATFRQMMPEGGEIDDPHTNIEAGIRYLAHGKKLLGTDDPRLLAAGYYQGYNRDSLKRGEIVDTNPDPRNPSVQKYAEQVAGRVRGNTLADIVGLDRSRNFLTPRMQAQEGKEAPKETAQGRNAFAYVNDSMINIANAITGLAKAGVDAVAPGSALSQSMADFMEMGRSNQSDWQKAKDRSLQEQLAGAGSEWEKPLIYVRHALTEDPLKLMSEGVGNIVPFAMLGRTLEAARVAEPVAQKIVMGVAGLMGMGEVRGNIYDKIQEIPDADLLAKSPEYAEMRQGLGENEAKHAFGSRFVEHLPELAVTALVSSLGGKYGLEGLAAKVGPKGVGRLGAAGIGFLDEGSQGLVEQGATNIGVRRADPDQPLTEDLALNFAQEGLLGGVGGLAAGGRPPEAANAIPPGSIAPPGAGNATAPGSIAPAGGGSAIPPGSVAPPGAPGGIPQPGPDFPAVIRSNRALPPGEAPEGVVGASDVPEMVPPPQPAQWEDDGTRFMVVPIDDALWEQYIKPMTLSGAQSWEEYRQRYPAITHMRLQSKDGKEWKPSKAPFIADEATLMRTIPERALTSQQPVPEKIPATNQPGEPVVKENVTTAPGETSPEQRPAPPVAESQAPVAVPGESQGDAGVAPGQAAEAPESVSPVSEVSSGEAPESVTEETPEPAEPEAIDDAAHQAATSPENDLPQPTGAQQEAGNYQKGHVKLHGLDISIENPKGSVRSGTDEDGKAWETTMAHHYGYIRRTEGADGDHVDVFLGDSPDSETVFVVDQVNPKTGKFDEHKVMLGFEDMAAANAAYLANYRKGWRGMQSITGMSLAEFKEWLRNGDTTKPLVPIPETKPAPPAKTEKQVAPDAQAAQWDAWGYGERQEVLKRTGYANMRAVVHRLSGTKWADLSEGEQASVRKAMQEAPADKRSPEEQQAARVEARRFVENELFTLLKSHDPLVEAAKEGKDRFTEEAVPAAKTWMQAELAKAKEAGEADRAYALEFMGNLPAEFFPSLYKEIAAALPKKQAKRKLENTGEDLRRWYDKKKAEKSTEGLAAEIDRMTVRGELLAPAWGENPTPGVQRWFEKLRDSVQGFKTWLAEEWSRSGEWNRGETGFEIFARAANEKPDWLVEQAQFYIDTLQGLSAALDGARTVAEAAAKMNEWFGDQWNSKNAEAARRIQTSRELRHFRSNGYVTDYFKAREQEPAKKNQPLTRPRLDAVERNGLPNTPRGTGDVTPAEMKRVFGFTDVGFGNWVASGQDQKHLNYAFDAFSDLSSFLNAPATGIGLGGNLYFTIGALGSGKFAAHYHDAHPGPGGAPVRVINVTNTRGDGTVAHEWGHALDFHLRRSAEGREVMGYIVRRLSLSYDPTYLRRNVVSALKGQMYMQGRKRVAKDDPLANANNVLDYYESNPQRFGSTDYKKQADDLGKDYWGNEAELFARAWEAWVFDNLGGRSDYLVTSWVGDGITTKEAGYRGTPYPQGAERKRFAQMMNLLRDHLEWTETGPAIKDFSKISALLNPETEWRQIVAQVRSELPEMYEQIQREAEAAKNPKPPAEPPKAPEPAPAPQEPVASEPEPPKTGPLSDEDLSNLFDQAAAELKEEQQEQQEPQQEPAAPPPGDDAPRWTQADLDEMLKAQDDASAHGIATAYKLPGFPTIHELGSLGNTAHLGFGSFRTTGTAPGKDARTLGKPWRMTWEGGGAMRQTASGMAYTLVYVDGPRPFEMSLQQAMKAVDGRGTVAAGDGRKKDPAPPPAPDATAADLIAAAGKLGVTGINEALTGLAELFGGKKLKSFPSGFDPETYAKAKPHFEASLKAFQAAGKTLMDFFKLLIEKFGEGVKPYAVQFAKEHALGADLGETKKQSATMVVAEKVRAFLRGGTPITSTALFAWAAEAYGGTMAQGKFEAKDAYDAAETGFNLYVRDTERFGAAVREGAVSSAKQVVEELRRAVALVPTQTRRSEEQIEFQQFSTPPAYAFVANWVANISPDDVYLEPSAGTGGLAAWGVAAGALVRINELSRRRAGILREMFGNSAVEQENADHLAAVFADWTAKPTVVVMNPPFSATAGRTGKRDTSVGANHVEQALQLLAPGGRLVAIVGRGMALDAPAFRDWWAKVRATYNVRANIEVGGKDYAKYGTSFETRILVIDKTGPTMGEVKTGSVESVAELPDLLGEVRAYRQAPDRSGEGPGKQPGQQDSGETPAAEMEEPGASPGDVPGIVGPGGAGGQAARPGKGGKPGSKSGRGRPGRGDGASGRDGTGASDGDGGNSGGGGADGTGADSGSVEVQDQKAQDEGGLTEAVFEAYRPQRLRVEGAKPHPGDLVQSAAMAAMMPPPVTYTPNLPKSVIDMKGGIGLSEAQLEAVVYAGQSFQDVFPDGTRRGFFIGDGTGVGKGREIAGILFDHIRQGKKRHVWISEKSGLIEDAKRDVAGVGMDPETVKEMPSNADTDIKGDGILFTTYATLRSGFVDPNSKAIRDAANELVLNLRPGDPVIFQARENPSDPDLMLRGKIVKREGLAHATAYDIEVTSEGPNKGKVYASRGPRSIIAGETYKLHARKNGKKKGQDKKRERIEQITQWLGEDFDGVIVFDEAHNMRGGLDMQGARGTKEATLTGLSGIALQKALPNARIVYVSATGATEVSNLSYATRLGLWGEGTPFAHVRDFVSKISASGISAMEIVAQSMKASGMYISRSLSYLGIKYNRVEHQLTPLQREMYDEIAKAWRIVMENIDKALEVTEQEGDSQAKKNARGQFWGAQLRFFNQIITSMQMPSVIDAMRADIAAGHAVVIQLVNTNEAAQERAVAKAKEAGIEELEDLDLTPRQILIDYLNRSFPVDQFEEYTDEDGNTQTRPVYDSQGKPVLNPDAVRMRDTLIENLGNIRMPDNPLDMIINEFGSKAVAEITGRGRRFVRSVRSDGGVVLEEQKLTPESRESDAKDFMDDKKRVLIFSDAGGTGFSFQADLREKNQRLRRHYLLQPGWRADKAVQGFGRTHRTNEKQPPEYVLVMTDVPGHKRFVSSIARRLDQLGALTKGSREAKGSELFEATDNLESQYATQAVHSVLGDMFEEKIPNGRQFLAEMGLGHMVEAATAGQQKWPPAQLPDVTKFINRILILNLETQRVVFGEFMSRLQEAIEFAKQRGTYDEGMQTIDALSARAVREKVVYSAPKTGAETKYLEVELTLPTRFRSFDDARGILGVSGKRARGFYYNNKTEKIYAITESADQTDTAGKVGKNIRLAGPTGSRYQLEPQWDAVMWKGSEQVPVWEKVDLARAKRLWDAQLGATPDTYTKPMHFVYGAIMPIWHRLPRWVSVARIKLEDGRRILGRIIDEDDLSKTLENLGVGSAVAEMSAEQLLEVLAKGDSLGLSNGWIIRPANVAGETRYEISASYVSTSETRILVQQGAFTETHQYRERIYIPTDKPDVLKRITAGNPAVRTIQNATRFSRSPAPGTAYTLAADVEAAIEPVRKVGKGLPPVVVAQSVRELPKDLQQAIREDGAVVRGAYHNGTIYLVGDNLRTPAESVFVLLHEAAHFGLRGVFGRELDAVLMKIHEDNAKVREEVARLRQEHPNLSLVEATEEVLADMAGRDERPSWVQRIVAWIRDWFRRRGIQLKMNDSDVLAIIAQARGFWQRDSKWTHLYSAPRFSSPAPVYYSQLAGMVASKGSTATPTEWKQRLAAWINGGQVKRDEVEWSGVREWLDLQQGKVTAEQVGAFLRENGVRVEETVLGDSGDPRPFNNSASAIAFIAQRRNMTPDDVMAEWGYEDLNDYVDLANSMMGEGTRPMTKFGQWQLPGGTNYREVLLRLPATDGLPPPSEAALQIARETRITIEALPREAIPAFSASYGAQFGIDPRDMEAAVWTFREDRPSTFQSGHWPFPNVLAHFRVSDRTDAEGRRVLFVQEIQSDWGQKGRKEGFLNRAAFSKEDARRLKEIQESSVRTPEIAAEWVELTNRRDESYGFRGGSIPPAPFVKKTESWVALALKRIVRMAAEEGYDAVAWATGAQNAKTFALSRQVDAVTASRNDYGGYTLKVKYKDGQNTTVDVKDAKELPDFVGKELAEKIVERTAEAEADKITALPDGYHISMDWHTDRDHPFTMIPPGQIHGQPFAGRHASEAEAIEAALIRINSEKDRGVTFTGLDLEIGGEGMKTFYDQIVPNVAKEVLRKVGGGALSRFTITERNPSGYRLEPDIDEQGNYIDRGISQDHPVPGFLITPAMREKAMGGFPLFSRAPAGASPPQAPAQSNPATNAPPPEGRFASGYREQATKVLDRMRMEVDPFAFLPSKKELLAMRYRLLGRIAGFDEIARDIKHIFSTASEEVQQAVYHYFLNPAGDPASIPDAAAAEMARRTKRMIEDVGDMLVERGLLSEEAREAHRGRYLPQVYLKFLLGDSNWKALGAGKKVSQQGYLKGRKLDRRIGRDGEVHVYDATTGEQLDQAFLDAVLGPVRDPGYLSSLAIVRPLRDMAILDYLEAISGNEAWVLPKSVIEWRGKRVSPWWAKTEADRLRNQSRHQESPDAENARQLADELDALADEALGALAGEHREYRQIPNTARYGRLRGILVRREIYEDLVGVNDFLPQDPGWAMSLLGYGGIGTNITQLWKAGKVSLNPPAQVRNFVSNMVLLQLSGVPLHRIPSLLVRGARQIMRYNQLRKNAQRLTPEQRAEVKHYLVALRYGVTESTFTAQEVYRMERDLLEIERRQGALKAWGRIKLFAAATMDWASDKYQFMEALGKTMKIMDEMERKGTPEADAALEAQEALFDYSLVSSNVRYLRNAPLGMPFLTFAVKVAPQLLKVARHHPQRFIPWVALAYGLPALVASMLDVDDDDLEKLKKALPEWLQDRGHAYILPVKDGAGRWQVLDLGYFFPWTAWTEPVRTALQGEPGKSVQALGMFSGPVSDLIVAMMTGRDSFTGREIVQAGDPPQRQYLQMMNYLWSMAMPPIVTDYGAAGHAIRAFEGTTNRFGDPLSTGGQAALRAVGVNIHAIHPETSRMQEVRRRLREIQDTATRLKQRLQDRGLSEQERVDLVLEYRDEMRRRHAKLAEYMAESDIDPKLRTVRDEEAVAP